jgi:hypothetical protein
MSDNMIYIQVDKKSNDIAKDARITGDDRFKVKNYLFALNHYNRSIAFAKSKNVAALAYGNRSAVYFENQLYNECLENIQLARENGYPSNKMSILADREAKCKELMDELKTLLDEFKDEKSNDIRDFFKLSYPANEKIPWVVDCVEVRTTEQFGRGIYAKQDLKAGDIICVEDAFFNYTSKDVYSTYFHCYNCFKSNRMNLIPCDKIASIMFCSTACKEDFYSKIGNMKKDILCADVKLLFDVAGIFGSVKAFDDYINRTDLKTLNKTIFDYDFSDPEDPDFKDKLLNCFLSLSTNTNPSEHDRHIRKYVSKKASDHLLSIYNLNQKEMKVHDGSKNMFVRGHTVSLFASLINHACVRNAQIISVENKAVTILINPVKAGEQIFFCYTPYVIMFSNEMKKELGRKHLFKCDCEACRSGTKEHERKFKKSHMLNVLELIEDNPAFLGDYEKAREDLNKSWDKVNKNPPPYYQLSNVPLNWSINILDTVAFQCSFPFPPFEG